MGKYLVLWEIDQTKIPVDPKERDDKRFIRVIN